MCSGVPAALTLIETDEQGVINDGRGPQCLRARLSAALWGAVETAL